MYTRFLGWVFFVCVCEGALFCFIFLFGFSNSNDFQHLKDIQLKYTHIHFQRNTNKNENVGDYINADDANMEACATVKGLSRITSCPDHTCPPEQNRLLTNYGVFIYTVVPLFCNVRLQTSWNTYLPGGFLAGSLWLGLPDCPESVTKSQKNVLFLICFQRISQSSEGLQKCFLRQNNEVECLDKVYFPKPFSSNILFIKLDECLYIFLRELGSNSSVRLFGQSKAFLKQKVWQQRWFVGWACQQQHEIPQINPLKMQSEYN